MNLRYQLVRADSDVCNNGRIVEQYTADGWLKGTQSTCFTQKTNAVYEICVLPAAMRPPQSPERPVRSRWW